MNINYPSIYRAFAFNFSWAVGLVQSRESSLQHSIDIMRAHTGGGMPNSTDSSAVGFVNRRLSPFNYNDNIATLSLSLARRASTAAYELLSTALNSHFRMGAVQSSVDLNLPLRTNLVLQPATVGPVPLVNASNSLDAGIPIYANSMHIGTANAFMTTFIVSLIVLGILGVILGCGYSVALVIRRLYTWKSTAGRFSYPAFVQAWLVRLVSVSFAWFSQMNSELTEDSIDLAVTASASDFHILSMDIKGLLGSHSFLYHYIRRTLCFPHLSILPYFSLCTAVEGHIQALFTLPADISHIIGSPVCTVSPRALLRVSHTSYHTLH